MAHLRRNVHFVIMKSVFNTDKRIHSMWDLKGSTVGRLSSPEESVMKDLNIVNDCTKIKIGKDKKEMLMNQLRSDVKFLAKLDIMDYSLLLGRHDRKKLVEERLIAEEEYRQSKVLKMKMKMKKAEESDRNNNDGNVKRSDTPMRRTRRASYIENSDILAVNKDFNNDRARRATDNDIAAIAAAAITVNSELEEISSNSNGGSFNEKELSSNSTDESYYGESDESEYDDEENCDGESDSIVSSEAVTLVNDENENEDENDSDNKIANSRNSNTSSARLSSLRTADSGETAHDTLRRNTDDHIKVMSLVEGEHQLPNPWTKRRDLGVESKIKLDVGIYNLGGGGIGDTRKRCARKFISWELLIFCSNTIQGNRARHFSRVSCTIPKKFLACIPTCTARGSYCSSRSYLNNRGEKDFFAALLEKLSALNQICHLYACMLNREIIQTQKSIQSPFLFHSNPSSDQISISPCCSPVYQKARQSPRSPPFSSWLEYSSSSS